VKESSSVNQYVAGETNMRRIALILAAACWLSASCTSTQKALKRPPVLWVSEDADNKGERSNQPERQGIMDGPKNFEMDILAENEGVCLGPDGRDVIWLGRNSKLQLVLKFKEIPSGDVKPDHLVVQLAHLKIPFARRTTEREYMSDIIDVNSRAAGLDTGPIGIALFYESSNGRFFLGTQGLLAIDAIPPSKPTNLRVTDRRCRYFSLSWDNEREETSKYFVQKWESGHWLTLHPGFKSPPIQINSNPEGRFRIMAVDCALNRSFSREINLDQDRPSTRAVRLYGRGPGSDILIGYLKNEAAERGLFLYEESDVHFPDPPYEIDVKISIDRPRPSPISGMSCWQVEATIDCMARYSGKNMHLTLRDVPGIDARIYGKSLDQALRGQGPNCFPERIGKPFIKRLFRQLDGFFPKRQELGGG